MRVYYKNVQLNPTQETDYTDLINKPSLNGVELEGDLSTEQIKVTWYGTQAEFDALPSHDPYTFYIIDDGTPVGTQDSYLDLADKPSINGQVLTGNKLPSDLDMYSRPDVDNLLASMRSIKVVAAKPAAPAANTMYYVGPDSESNYHVYLYDALLNEIDLGMAMNQLYREGTAIDIDSANTINVKIDDATIKTNTNNELYVKKLDTTLTKGANTANAVKAVWVENGDVKEHTVDSGTNVRPVYIDDGVIKPVNQAASGAYTNFVPYVSNAGPMDIGQNIDFHTPTSTADYDVRLSYNSTANTSNLSVYGGTAYGFVPVTGTAVSVGSNIRPVYVNNGTVTKGTSMFLNDGTIDIPENADLNTLPYTSPGVYVCTQSTIAETLTHCPTKVPFRMEVLNVTKDDAGTAAVVWSSRIREITDWNGNKYIQQINTTNSTTPAYQDWYVIFKQDSPSPVLLSLNNVGHSVWTSATDYKNRVYSLSTTAQNNGVAISGAGLGNALTIRLTASFNYSAAGYQDLFVSGISGAVEFWTFSGFANGTSITPTMKTLTPGTGNDYVLFTSLINSSTVSGYMLDITWTRERTDATRWWGIGNIWMRGINGTGCSFYLIADSINGTTVPKLELRGGTLTSASANAEIIFNK